MLKGQSHRVKHVSTERKVLSQGKFIGNIKALGLTVQKLLARLNKSFRQLRNYRTKTICLGGIKTHKKWIILILCAAFIDHLLIMLLLNGTAIHVGAEINDKTLTMQFYYFILS